MYTDIEPNMLTSIRNAQPDINPNSNDEARIIQSTGNSHYPSSCTKIWRLDPPTAIPEQWRRQCYHLLDSPLNAHLLTSTLSFDELGLNLSYTDTYPIALARRLIQAGLLTRQQISRRLHPSFLDDDLPPHWLIYPIQHAINTAHLYTRLCTRLPAYDQTHIKKWQEHIHGGYLPVNNLLQMSHNGFSDEAIVTLATLTFPTVMPQDCDTYPTALCLILIDRRYRPDHHEYNPRPYITEILQGRAEEIRQFLAQPEHASKFHYTPSALMLLMAATNTGMAPAPAVPLI